MAKDMFCLLYYTQSILTSLSVVKLYTIQTIWQSWTISLLQNGSVGQRSGFDNRFQYMSQGSVDLIQSSWVFNIFIFVISSLIMFKKWRFCVESFEQKKIISCFRFIYIYMIIHYQIVIKIKTKIRVSNGEKHSDLENVTFWTCFEERKSPILLHVYLIMMCVHIC